MRDWFQLSSIPSQFIYMSIMISSRRTECSISQIEVERDEQISQDQRMLCLFPRRWYKITISQWKKNTEICSSWFNTNTTRIFHRIQWLHITVSTTFLKLINWLSEWVSEWVSEWMSEWVSEWVSDWVSEWESEWVSEWVWLKVYETLYIKGLYKTAPVKDYNYDQNNETARQ